MSTIFPLADRGPLRILFLNTSLPVGGAETLLANLVRRMDRERFLPYIGCLKHLDEIGEELSQEFPVFANLLAGKFDVRVFYRLNAVLKRNRIDAICTVGAGDKMFWGRLCAKWCNLPVIMSALHSTGWPDVIGRMNRWLTPWTDAFVGVAPRHGDFLIDEEGFAKEKVFVIPNGIDTDRFRRQHEAGRSVREELGIAADTRLCGIVAALRPEKNHRLFLETALKVNLSNPGAHFVVVGDGAERAKLEADARESGLGGRVHFLGTRKDIVRILSALDVFLLTSHMEANPVSVLEALATCVPVVATDVGSLSMTVKPGVTGFLAEPNNAEDMYRYVMRILGDKSLQQSLGAAGRREVVQNWSLDVMVNGYQDLISGIYQSKAEPGKRETASNTTPSTGEFASSR